MTRPVEPAEPDVDAQFIEALERGIARFNRQDFFGAYEVWEERWNAEESEGADLLQGLLQVAVGFSKLTDGNPRGTAKLLASGALKLELYAPRAYGVDIQALLDTVQAWRTAVDAMVETGSAKGIDLPNAQVVTSDPKDS